MSKAFYSFGVIYVPVDELGVVIKELHSRGKKNFNFEYNPSLQKFVFFNTDNNSTAKDVHEILREAKLVKDPEHFDPVAGKF